MSDDAPARRDSIRGGVLKRSLSIQGHRTSISLEEAFWQELVAMAENRKVSIAALVAAVDAERKGVNLSSALRVFVLKTVQRRRD